MLTEYISSSVYWPKEKDGLYYCDYYLGGIRCRARLGYGDETFKPQADKLAAAFFEECWTSVHEDLGPTLEEAVKAYEEFGGEVRYFGPILAFLGSETYCSSIDGSTIHEVCVALKGGRKWTTVRRMVKTPLTALMNFVAGKTRLPQEHDARMRYLQPEEAERHLSVA